MNRDPVPGFDSITGLPNRPLFIARICEALADPSQDQPLAVLSVHLPGFNAIPVDGGVEIADQLLAAAAGRIQHLLSPNDFLARVHHHEFGVLLRDVSGPADAERISLAIQNSFSFPFKMDPTPVELAVNIGIAISPGRRRSPESLWKQAHFSARETKGTAPNRDAVSRFATGTHVGRFKITSFLGKGGMGEVYCAYDSMLNREVAIKVLHEKVCNDRVARKRFQQELQAIGSLSHVNIIALYDVGSFRGRIYAVMERLNGETLRDQLEHGGLNTQTSYHYALQITEGLAAAHEKGIMHRDLKPENVFVTQDHCIKILDFGLARFTSRNRPDTEKATLDTFSRVTEPGLLLGTVGYMSPEQIRGDEMDQTCDVFAFGAVFYEMLSGERAFDRPHPIDTFNAILTEEPAHSVMDKIPEELKEVLKKCLRKDSTERFRSAREVNQALKGVAVGIF